MGDADGDEFTVKAVVLNGRVVLDAPLAVPDGTLVTVQRYHEGDLPGDSGPRPSLDAMVRQLATLVDLHEIKLRVLERSAKHQGGPEAA
jgi:hypothetical protein